MVHVDALLRGLARACLPARQNEPHNLGRDT